MDRSSHAHVLQEMHDYILAAIRCLLRVQSDGEKWKRKYEHLSSS